MKTVLQRRVAAGAVASGAVPAAEVSRKLRNALRDALARNGFDADAPGVPPLPVPRASRVPLAPAMLAAAHPGGAIARETMRAVYERCLAHYRDTIGAAGDDIGVAAAHFIAANLQALHGMSVPPAARQRLREQVAAIFAAGRAWAQAGERDRQACFEKLAILGVLIDESAAQAKAQGPEAVDNVQRAARGYLMEFLGVEADALELRPAGLAMRSRVAAAA